jgi:cytidyltransferase-like protein
MTTIVLITGGFDPIHSGHISYIEEAKKLGDVLIVGANSDEWLARKKGRSFMSWDERAKILSSIKGVDRVINYNDDDNSSKDAIRKVREIYPKSTIIFANGGDRTKNNIPEMDIQDENLQFVFSVGGDDKKNSSSWILQEWKSPKTSRPWGYYRVLHEVGKEVKLKELTVDPGKSLSMQRHSSRNEFWFVAEGIADVYTIDSASTDFEHLGTYYKNQSLFIYEHQWHQLKNNQDHPLKVIEIQFGKNCIEEDIERK